MRQPSPAAHLAIIEVAIAYAAALDDRTWELEALFTEDAIWEYGSMTSLRGPDAIAAALKASVLGLQSTQHLLGNHVVRVDQDVAEHSCYFQAAHVAHGAPGRDLYIFGGRYHDHLRRTPSGWRISHRSLGSSWTFGNPGVLGGLVDRTRSQ